MTSPQEITPEEVPDKLVETARQAFRTAPVKRDGQPTRLRYALAAVMNALAQQAEHLAQPLAQDPVPDTGPAPWPGPQITLRPNAHGHGVHQLLVDGQDISRAVRRAVLRTEPGCWPRLDVELKIYEHGGIDATGAEVVLPPETVLALKALGWGPPPPRPDGED